jgi:hypothetical protein
MLHITNGIIKVMHILLLKILFIINLFLRMNKIDSILFYLIYLNE